MRLTWTRLFAYLLVVATVLYGLWLSWPQLRPVTDPSLPRLSTLLSHTSEIPQRQRVLGYEREAFGSSWGSAGACTVREAAMLELFDDHQAPCTATGTATDPYTGLALEPDDVEIDHVIPLSAAWDLGAHRWDEATRVQFANDPINLVATAAEENRAKSDQLPSSWLPTNRHRRCWYSRRIAVVAVRYSLPLPADDIAAMRRQCRLSELLKIY